MAGELIVKIESEAWVKEANSYMNLDPQFKTFFPDDCFIARGTGRENQHLLADRGIRLEYQGVRVSSGWALSLSLIMIPTHGTYEFAALTTGGLTRRIL